MFGIDRRALQIVWTVFIFIFGLALIYAVRSTLVLFALALFLAHLLSPVVERVHLMIPPTGSRGPAIAIVYVVLIGALVGIAIPVGSTIGEEASTLASHLPQTVQSNPLAKIPLPARLEGVRDQIDTFLVERVQELSQNVEPLLSAAGRQVLLGLGTLLRIVLIPILAFFALKDGTQIRRLLVGLFEPRHRDMVNGILLDLHMVLAQYMRALLLLALATFTSFSIFFSIAGVPYGLLLAGLAATLEVIPVIGPLIAAVTIVLVALLSGYGHFLMLIIFLGVYRMFQDYVLSPYLMSEGVEIHPLLVLLGVLAGEQIAGVPGMFFSVPVIAAVRVIMSRMIEQQREEGDAQ